MTWDLFMKLVRFQIKEKREYRGDFWLGVLAQMVNYAASYIIIWLFLQRFESIAGWKWPEIALLYSLGLFTYALGASFSYVQMRDLEGEVRSGTFDSVLVKPLNPYLYVICRGFNVAYIAHLSVSSTVLIWSLNQLDIEWTVLRVLYVIGALISGAMIQCGLMTMVGACSFIWIRTGYLFSLFFRLKEFINYPISVYHTAIQALLIFIVPLAFVNFFPGAFLLQKEAVLISQWGTWAAPLVGPIILGLGYWLWMACVNKYQGAGG